MTDPDLIAHFGTTIKSQRAALGLSQEELADRAGLHRTYVSDVERGVRNVSLISIEKLALALDLSISRLFGVAADQEGPVDLEILLVENDLPHVEVALSAFQKARVANPVHVAHDGVEALDFVFARGAHSHRQKKPLPGVILLNLHLPKVNGLEVLRQLRAEPRTRQIPVAIITTDCASEACDEYRHLGVNAFLVKPFDFSDFSELTPQLQFRWKLVPQD